MMPTGHYKHESRPILQRFAEKFSIGDECWLWEGFLNEHGYGQFRIGSRNEGAHRASWLILRGSIPGELSVLHKCDTPNCVNPNHLYLGTQKQNMQDALTRKRLFFFKNTLAARQRLDDSRPNSAVTKRGEQHYAAKLTWDDVRKIRASKKSRRQLAIEFGVGRTTIDKVVLSHSWKETGQ